MSTMATGQRAQEAGLRGLKQAGLARLPQAMRDPLQLAVGCMNRTVQTELCKRGLEQVSAECGVARGWIPLHGLALTRLPDSKDGCRVEPCLPVSRQ